MAARAFEHVVLESFARHLPDERLGSGEIEARLEHVYRRLDIQPGTLQRLSGVEARRHWGPQVKPSDGAVAAAELALQASGLDRSRVGAVINCSVTRDFFEPATACIVHGRLGLSEDGVAMDVSNACAGFSSGILVLAGLIESGAVEAGLVVSCETMSQISESTIARLQSDPGLERAEFLELLPALTLGSGAAAFLLCRRDLARDGHRILGCSSRTASDLSQLCLGDADYCFYSGGMNPLMRSNSAELLARVAPVARRAWEELSGLLGWDTDRLEHVLAHQVGSVVDKALVREIGLDESAYFRIYPEYGNQVSAALPISLVLAAEQQRFSKGQRLLLMGFGSGLNAMATAVEW